MRLLLPSLFIAIYLFLSLVRPLSLRPAQKGALGALLLIVSLKYIFYEVFGGSFFRPELPVPVLLAAETLYASLVILFFLAIIKDAASLALWLSRLAGSRWNLPFSPAARASALVLLALTSGIWGSFQAVRVPEVRTVEVSIPDLPRALEGFTLVQLSDIHIGPLLKKDWLDEVVTKANSLTPDTIVLTGDYIDGLPAELAEEVQPLGRLQAHHGVYGVNGNHEYYYDAPGWQPVFRSLGIDMLNNEHRVLPGGIIIGGITDRTAKRFGLPGPDLAAAFAGAPDGPRILLSHQPAVGDAVPSSAVDLQLSGHTHGGLLFFLKPLIAYYNKGFVSGLNDTGTGQVYVASGTGLWSGFSCRLGVPSEITRIVLKRKN
ncbi:MAG: metallophosphoesterase [Mailhella sp.]|nr:metallophosphoesterase [Mailhella sp.]